LSFKTQPPAGVKQQLSPLSSSSKTKTLSYDDVPSAISFAPTFDSSTAADTHDTHHEHMDDLSHMSPKNVSEMMKEQDDYAANIIIDVDTNHQHHAVVDDLSHLSPQNGNNEMMMKEEQEEECEDVLSHLSATYIADMVKQQVEYNKLLLRTAEDGVTELQTENETTKEENDDEDEEDVSIEEDEQWWVDTEIDNEKGKNPAPGSDDDSDDNVILSHLSSNYISDLMKKQQHVFTEEEAMKKLLNVRQEIEEQPQPSPSQSSTGTSITTTAEAAANMTNGNFLFSTTSSVLKNQEDEEGAVSAYTVLFVILVSYLVFLFMVTDFASYQEQQQQQQDIIVEENNSGEEIVAKRMMSTVVANVVKKWMKKIIHK